MIAAPTVIHSKPLPESKVCCSGQGCLATYHVRICGFSRLRPSSYRDAVVSLIHTFVGHTQSTGIILQLEEILDMNISIT